MALCIDPFNDIATQRNRAVRPSRRSAPASVHPGRLAPLSSEHSPHALIAPRKRSRPELVDGP